MQINSSKSDIIWSYIGIIMSMGSNLIILPFLVKYIDSEMLGLWYVYLSIGGVVTLFDFGFNPTLARNVAYCWSGTAQLNEEGVTKTELAGPNYELLQKLIKTCKLIYLVISLLALLVLLTLGSVYIYKIAGNLFSNTVVISWLLYSIAIFFNLYYGYYATFLRGVGAVSQYNKINVFARSIQIIISVLLLVAGCGILAVSLSYLLYGFLLRILSKRAFCGYCNVGVHLNSLQNKVSLVDVKNLFGIVWHNAWKDGLVAVSNYCANQASTLIASFYLSLTETGIYSISVQMVTAIATISAGLYTAYQPALQSAYANTNYRESIKLMSLAMIAFSVLFVCGTILLLTIGIPILQWVKPENTYDVAVTLGISIYYYFYKRQSYYASFISNTNHVPYVKSYVVSSVFGVILSLCLINFLQWGVWGIIIGQFLPQLVYNTWKWPKEVYKMLETTWSRFVVEGLTCIKNKMVRIYKAWRY